ERIEFRIRAEENVNAIKAEPRFVHHVGGEGVRLVEGKDLPVRSPRVPKSGDVIPLQYWFTAPVLLKSIITVQAIVGVEVVADISGPLIDVDRRSCRPAGEPVG